MKHTLLGSFVVALAGSAFASDSCRDFSGTYRFIGPCDPVKTLQLPLSDASSFGGPTGIDHRDSFAIRQKNCHSLELDAIPGAPDGISRVNSYPLRSYEIKEYYFGGVQQGNKSVITIDQDTLFIKNDRWEYFLLLFTIVRNTTTWNLSKVKDRADEYSLNVETYSNSIIHYGGSKSISCKLKKA
jgi:hypothetical protein